MMTTVSVQLHRVSAFELAGEYKIRLTFEDDTERLIDFEPTLYGPIFGELRDYALFKSVTLDPDFGTLVWSNGADIDPAVLYDWPNHVERIIERHKDIAQ
jgi:hypothetical protein